MCSLDLYLTNKSWNNILEPLLKDKLESILNNIGDVFYPDIQDIFKAFNNLDYDKIKVIILGQDPYYNGQADGLAFSCKTKIQPSLKNIFKALELDLNIKKPNNYNLDNWEKEGVLLLNSSLTVEPQVPLSHIKYWEDITDEIIKYISNNTKNKVFLLWGNYAKSKIKYIDETNHCIITGCHPSPFNGHKFIGYKYFSQCNEYLINNNIEPINWNSIN
jgi:uracil-DNA glycosylase